MVSIRGAVLVLCACASAHASVVTDCLGSTEDGSPFVPARADTSNLPDVSFSTFDTCLGRSPVNDAASPSSRYVFAGVLRDATNAPVANVPALDVELQINAPCMNPIVLHPIGPSNAQGEVFWDASTLTLPGGSCAAEGVVGIWVQWVLFASLDDVRSPDQDGDGQVALADLIVFQQAFVNQAPTFEGDLDCEGNIGLTDLVWFQEHFVAGQP